MKKYLVVLSMASFALVSCVSGGQYVELEVRIAMKGAEPFSYLVIEDINSGKEYKIVNEAQFDLKNRQNQIVKLSGNVSDASSNPLKPAKLEVSSVSK